MRQRLRRREIVVNADGLVDAGVGAEVSHRVTDVVFHRREDAGAHGSTREESAEVFLDFAFELMLDSKWCVDCLIGLFSCAFWMFVCLSY